MTTDTLNVERIKLEDQLERTRKVAALEVRLTGGSYEDIIDAGIYDNIREARAAITTLFDGDSRDNVDVYREMELMRLDRLMASYWPLALAGLSKPGLMVLRIMDRRAKLLGLDAPQKVDVSSMITEMATAAGLDPMSIVAEVNRIASQTKVLA